MPNTKEKRALGPLEANAYLLARVREPGLARDLREPRPFEALLIRAFGELALYKVNKERLVEGTAKNLQDIVGIIQAEDPEYKENYARAYTDELVVEDGVVAVMIKNMDNHKVITLIFKKHGEETFDKEVRLQLDEKGKILIPQPNREVPQMTRRIPLEKISMAPQIVDLYDLSARCAEAMAKAKSEQTLVIHGSAEHIG